MKSPRTTRAKSRNPRQFSKNDILGVERMSRAQAIQRICACLKRSTISPRAKELIELFNIHPDELAEAGISFEVLKAVSKQSFFF